MLPELRLRIHREPAPRSTGRRAGAWRRADGIECGRSFVDETRRVLEWDALGLFALTQGSTTVDAWPRPELDDEAVRGQFVREIEPILLQALGCLNHALLTAAAAQARGLRLAGWIACAMDPDMARAEQNLRALQQRLAAPLLGRIRHMSNPAPDRVLRTLNISRLNAVI